MQNEHIIFDDDSVVVQSPIFGSRGDVIGYRCQTIMTKEIFITCYEKWILNNNKEDSNAELC